MEQFNTSYSFLPNGDPLSMHPRAIDPQQSPKRFSQIYQFQRSNFHLVGRNIFLISSEGYLKLG